MTDTNPPGAANKPTTEPASTTEQAREICRIFGLRYEDIGEDDLAAFRLLAASREADRVEAIARLRRYLDALEAALPPPPAETPAAAAGEELTHSGRRTMS